MTQLIRPQVFETNSSSSHSVSINTGELPLLYDTLYPNDEGELVLESNEFGWEYKRYNDAATKASYCAIYFRDSPQNLNILEIILKEQTGASSIILPDEESYIDHQSTNILNKPLGLSATGELDKELLRKFIFSKNSWLFTGNDNSNTPKGFKNVPVYKEKGQVSEKDYKYELVIEGLDTTYKMTNKVEDKDIPSLIQNYLENNYDTYWDLYWTEDKVRLNSQTNTEYKGNRYCYDPIYIHTEDKSLSLINTSLLYSMKNEEGRPLSEECKEELIASKDPRIVLTINYEIKEL